MHKNIVIIGCSNSGAYAAKMYDMHEHNVYLFDKDEKSFLNLEYQYSGVKHLLDVVDVSELKSIVPNQIDLVLVLTNDENQNILIATIIAKALNVKKIIARISDINKEFILDELGIININTTKAVFAKVVANVDL